MPLTKVASHLFGKLAELKAPGFLARWILHSFVGIYRPNLNESRGKLEDFSCLAEFFVRELRDGVRPIASAPVVPVDGQLRNFGKVHSGRLEQIKGRDYSIERFLESSDLARRFQEGFYLNFYLSPKDCHHVFSPVAGVVNALKYIPGALLPVNDLSINSIPDLFLKNERLIIQIASDQGEILVVMVGAFNVGKIYSAVGEIGAAGEMRSVDAVVHAGQRIGTFGLGSSVVVIFERAVDQNALALREGQCVRYGEPLLRDYSQTTVVSSGAT